jgi:hypothetical protein
MSNVFALLINSEGEAEEINLGSLYIDQDDHGFISHIEIEPYSFEDLEQYEPHFDEFDSEFPEVPQRVHFGLQAASIEGFFQAEGSEVDFEEFEEEPDQARFEKACEKYQFILKIAYRLYERTRREEPVFVGYVDVEKHQQLAIKEILNTDLPIRHLSMMQRRELNRQRRREKAIEAGRNLCRVTLRSEAETSDEFPAGMVLYVGAAPGGFPLRFVPISGLSDAKRPLSIMANGNVRIGDADGFFTNLMATKMSEGETVILWKDRCRSSRIFRIVQVESFVGAGTTAS